MESQPGLSFNPELIYGTVDQLSVHGYAPVFAIARYDSTLVIDGQDENGVGQLLDLGTGVVGCC
jgi:hypothetical protein